MKFFNKRLSIFSEAEEAALYEIPDFDDEQRLNYLNFTAEEQTLIQSCSPLSTQIHCALQIGYFGVPPRSPINVPIRKMNFLFLIFLCLNKWLYSSLSHVPTIYYQRCWQC